ncbi:MAG: sodium:solute symporter family protein [Bacteriovoracaceae bacterium]|nr:sodium:solute symporter family protein [Bacteriovoracaceae bacterium]
MSNSLPSVPIYQLLSSLDWIVFFGFQFLTIAIVIYGQRLLKSPTRTSALDYLLMGRQLTLPFFIATLVASWYGGIFGVTQIAFEQGVYNFVTQGIFWYITYIIFALFLVDKIRPYHAVTLPEILGKMFGPGSVRLGSLFNFVNIVPVAYALSMGIFLQTLFGGSLQLCILVGTLFVMAYSFYGGFRAVVFSDFLQFLIMCLAVFLVALVAYFHFGGVSFLKQNLPAAHFDWRGGESYASIFSWGLIALATLVDPCFYQRVLAASRPQIAKRGILISTLIWVGFDLCTTLGGMYARAVLPHADPKQGYFQFALELLPSGLRGVFLAGAFATIISTLSSFMHIAGVTITYDLLPKKFHHKKGIHQLGFLLVGLFTILLSFAFDGRIKEVWKTMGSYAAGCLLVPMMINFWRPKTIDDKTFQLSAISGALAITLWKIFGSSELDGVYVGIVVTTSIIGLRKLLS